MSKYILIDLEDTITIHNYNNRLESVMLKWLEFNQVTNPLKVYNNSDFKNRGTRLKLLGINEKEYEKWYKNFNDVEFIEYCKNYENKKITIDDTAISFIENCKIPLILVSNSSPKWIDFILKEYNLTNKFKFIFHRDYSINDVKKPNHRVIDIIEKNINDKISKDSIVIGDSYSDYEFAQNCNLEFISMYNKINNNMMFDNFRKLLEYINDVKLSENQKEIS